VAGAGHYAIFMQQAIAPVGECRNDIDICAALAERLGIEGYNDKTEDEWLRELTKHAIDDYDTFPGQGPGAAARPRRRGGLREGDPRPDRHPFTTPSGKIEIYSMSLAARPDPYGLGAIPPIPPGSPSRSTRSIRCGW